MASYTAGLGKSDISNVEAYEAAREASPDYVTGGSPYQYPCRYMFFPYVMIVDLRDATILFRQEADDVNAFEQILDIIENL